MSHEYLTTREAEKIFNVSYKTLDRKIGKNEIPYTSRDRRGKPVRFVEYSFLASKYKKRKVKESGETGQDTNVYRDSGTENDSVLFDKVIDALKDSHKREMDAASKQIIYMQKEIERKDEALGKKEQKLLESANREEEYSRKISELEDQHAEKVEVLESQYSTDVYTRNVLIIALLVIMGSLIYNAM